MINNINGINEDLIDILIKDIYNCSENIHKNIENINNLVNKTSYVFKCDISDSFTFNYEKNLIKINDIYVNIEGYNKILLNVKYKYQNLDNDMVLKIKKDDNIKGGF